MSLPLKNLSLVALAATVIGLTTPGAFAASEYVIVAVEPPADIPPLGKLYRLGDLLHIERGSTVTLLGNDGSVSVLPGPADVVVTDDASEAGSAPKPAEASSSLTAISELLTNAGTQLQAIGASRGISGTSSIVDPWTIPLEDGSTACIRDGKLEFWRERGDKAVVSIRYDAQSDEVKAVWDADDPKLIIPGSVPADVESVGVKIDDRSFRITIKHLPSSVGPREYVGLYAWMVGSGCLRQASALIQELASQNRNR